MTTPQKRSRLAEWGSRKSTPLGIAVFVLVGLLLLGAAGAVVVWLGRGIQDDHAALERTLNGRYEESVTIRVTVNRNHTREDVILDGVERSDCDATDEGYLECSRDPQPTLVDE
ncbi:hypothetical protein SGUI_2081 [Serinicoccus hydrothermalis]|uniref:Uncharacterized protein n=1 Tax=Serinicoccus hydrothermalis TaxID=1758689 RepID=A0A1B1NDG0_9MICO|nr:hypothetical protein [Serinicoccus hydrothermalis]ANS79477.1 hypothetical protein SGUI_2081 [Serinicoccus hydrothermalis]